MLPYSGLRFSISSRHWQDSYAGDRRPWIPPSLPVAVRADDDFAGRDAALDAILEWQQESEER